MTGDASAEPTGETDPAIEIRQARPADEPAVVAFTEDTWSERGRGDYLPRVFGDWVESDGPRQRTFVADVTGREEPAEAVAGVVQTVLLADGEAWGQGMRVNPRYRGRGVSRRLTHAGFDWARERGATAVRIMVFSWNRAGLGAARSAGYAPAAEFRWVHPEPDPEGVSVRPGVADGALELTTDPGVAWAAWHDGDADDRLAGLTLSTEETWALSELTRDRLRRLAEDDTERGLGRVLAVRGPDGARAMTYRTRTYERTGEDGPTEWAEYGVGAWTDLASGRRLLSAVARDAAALGVDRTRVLVPETTRYVSDAAYLQVDIADEPDFVLSADLAADYRAQGHLRRPRE
jgi:GNAT superfamily N-acetyltransferase